jgi:hypothetical protein
MQQNLASAVDLWKFISNLLLNPHINEENAYLNFIESILRQRIHALSLLSNYQEHQFNNEILILRNLCNSVPRTSISIIDSLSRIVLQEENFSQLSKN